MVGGFGQAVCHTQYDGKEPLFYMQEAGYFKTVWPYFTERASLNSFLVLYTLSGEGHLSYEGQEYEVTEGACFLSIA